MTQPMPKRFSERGEGAVCHRRTVVTALVRPTRERAVRTGRRDAVSAVEPLSGEYSH